MFIVEGAITVVLGFFAYPLLPNYPGNTKWLNEAERALAQYRLSLEVDGDTDDVEESVFVGLKQAASDPKTWLLVLILTSAVVSMSFTCEFYVACFQGASRVSICRLLQLCQTFSHRLCKHLGTQGCRHCCLLRRRTSSLASSPCSTHGTVARLWKDPTISV
jgi:hypothetical protein